MGKNFILLLLVAYSCSRQESNLYHFDEYVSFQTFSPMEMVDRFEEVGMITGSYQIADAGAYLAVLSRNSSGYITFIEKESGRVALTCGTLGRGPEEFLSFPRTNKHFCTNDSGETILYLSDDRHIGGMNVDGSICAGRAVFETFDLISKYLPDGRRNYSFREVFPLETGDFVSLGVSYDDPRDGLLDPPVCVLQSGIRRKKFDIYPSLLENTEYPDIPLFAYSDVERVSRDGTKAVLSSIMFDASIVLDLQTGKSALFQNESGLFLDDVSSMNRDGIIARAQYNTIDIDAGVESFVQLYDGRRVSDVESGLVKNNPSVRIWDFYGNLRCCLLIGKSAQSIAYDELKEIIYVLDEEDCIYSICFSDILG